MKVAISTTFDSNFCQNPCDRTPTQFQRWKKSRKVLVIVVWNRLQSCCYQCRITNHEFWTNFHFFGNTISIGLYEKLENYYDFQQPHYMSFRESRFKYHPDIEIFYERTKSQILFLSVYMPKFGWNKWNITYCYVYFLNFALGLEQAMFKVFFWNFSPPETNVLPYSREVWEADFWWQKIGIEFLAFSK